MAADPRLAAIPALRRLAEDQARDILDAIRSQRGPTTASTEGAVYEATLTLLCDLTRPASRDAVARLVGEALGLECGATAPELHRVFPDWWEIRAAYSRERQWAMCFAEQRDHDSDPPEIRGHKVAIHGISVVTDPAESLTIIALHVLGRTP